MVLRLASRLGLLLLLANAAACDDGGTGGAGGGGAGGAGGTGGVPNGGAGGVGATGGSGGSAPLTCDATYTNVPSGSCDVLQQDCAPGKTCKIVAFGGSAEAKCVAQDGLKTLAMPCPSGDDAECAAGLICRANTCTAYCCPDNDQPCGGGSCSTQDQYGANVTAFICSFDQLCALFDPTSCPDGKDCYVSDTGQGLATCSPSLPGQGGDGETCMYLNECLEGLFCANGLCRYYCDTTKPQAGLGLGGCPVGQSCFPQDFGIPNVGVCSN